MGRVRGAVNARALSLARKAVDLCNCWRREAAAECLVEKQVELVSFGVEFVVEALQPNRREGSDSKRSSRTNGVSPSLLELR